MMPRIFVQLWCGRLGVALMNRCALRIYRGVGVEFVQIGPLRVYRERMQ
jgi:hypothetical protein